jgi:Flp pilus assembly protein TadG
MTGARFQHDTQGAIAVEFAILVPIMLAMMLGSFTASRLARASMKIWTVAQSMGDLVAQQTTVTSTQVVDFCAGAALTLAPFSGTIKATVASVTMNTAGTARTVDWQDTTCGSGTAIGNVTTLAMPYTLNAQDSVIIVQVTYLYAFPPSFVLPSSLTGLPPLKWSSQKYGKLP